jgi:hypothetical protein
VIGYITAETNLRSKNMKKIVIFCLLVVVLMPVVALAQTATNTCSPGSGSPSAQLGNCIGQVYLWALGVAGVLALGMLVIGGYKVITASGNAQRATDGKSYIYSSLIGIAILLGAYLLLSTINPDLTNFQVNVSCLGKTPGADGKITC